MKTFSLHSRDYLHTPEKKRFFNEKLFTEVAPKYDLITRLLSFGRDRAWKKHMIAALPHGHPSLCLDLACGTGDLTRMVAARYSDSHLVGMDLTPSMIERARGLTNAVGIRYLVGDMNDLPFECDHVDFVTGGYALRNAPDLSRALAEIHRVLKPGGVAAFLDFSKPANRMGQLITYALLKTWGGFWGLVLHRHADVYGYIADSLATYPDRCRLRAMFEAQGFSIDRSKLYFGGLVQWVIIRKAS